MFSESSEQSKDEMILEEYTIDNIDKETLESYRKRFKLHKGDNHEWNNLSDRDFLYMIRALDTKTDKLTLAGLLMLGKVQDIIQVRPNYFLDYREIKDATTTERWLHRITSSADEEWAGNLRVPIDIVMEGGRSDPRYAILHQMFSYLGFGERAGSGLYMISTVWKSKNWIKLQIK